MTWLKKKPDGRTAPEKKSYASGFLLRREVEAVPFTVRSFTARAYNRAFRRGYA
jgi:hypothetical protein